MGKEISINICGDFYISPLADKNNYFTEGILQTFTTADYNVVNLESPITVNKRNKITKSGPNMSGSTYTFSYLKEIRIDLVTLANNHIMDYGEQGLTDTIDGCLANSINFIGAGGSLEEAKRPFLIEMADKKITFLNFTENEFSTPYADEAGANPLNAIDNIRQIKDAKAKSDLIIVIIHGGNEMYHLPNPRMVDQYRFYAESGASVIIGHHTHCISGFEVHQKVPIFYGLGNFLFTEKYDSESWYTGLILNLRISEDAGIKWELIPIRQHNVDYKLSLLKGIEKQSVLSEVEKYSSIIADEDALLERWRGFVKEKYTEIIDIFSPIQFFDNRYIIKLLQKTGFSRLFRRKKHFTQMLNHLRCESLSDLSKNAIARLIER